MLRRNVIVSKIYKNSVIFFSYKKLFWTDWGVYPRVEVSDMDGKDRKTIVGGKCIT